MQSIAGKLSRYLFTGGVAAIVDIGGFGLLSHARMSVVIAAACSFGAAMVVNFLLTARWVFHVSATKRGFALFFAGACVGAVVNVTVTSISVIYLALPRTVAKTFAVGMSFLLNFWINARIVFYHQTKHKAATVERPH